MARTQRTSERIVEEVTAWPGVTAGPGERGEFSFKLGRREMGHLHGDHAAHFGFPKEVWAGLFEQGRIDYHPVFPGRPGFGAREDRDRRRRLRRNRVAASQLRSPRRAVRRAGRGHGGVTVADRAERKDLMRVWLRRFGGPDELRAEDTADPVPGPIQALIEVAFANITFVETQFRASGAGPFKAELPMILGNWCRRCA